jgi:hypothetical protein
MFKLPTPTYAQEGTGAAAPEPATTPQNLTGQEEFSDEEIDLPNEDGTEPEAPEAPAEPDPAKTFKRRGPKRYATLTHERDEARGYAAQLQAELELERGRAAEFEAKANEASTVAMHSYAAKSESDLREARAALSAAIESGDPGKITEASERLASSKATMDDVEAWKKSEQAKQNAPATPRQAASQPQAAQIPELPDEVKGWVMENRYFDFVQRDSGGNVVFDRSGKPMRNPDYDDTMHTEATLFATNLERKISDGRLNYKVSSPEYFKAVEEHMRDQFPDYFGEEEQEQPAAPVRRGSPVAAPTRSMSSGGQAVQNPSKFKLTSDQLRFVKRMVDNGGGPKYPQGHARAFQPMSYDDAKVSYARRIMKTNNQ